MGQPNGQGGGQGNGAFGGNRTGQLGGGNWNGGANGGWWGGRDWYGYGGGNVGGQNFPDPQGRQGPQMSQADMERLYQDSLRQLNDLRQAFRDEPSTLGDITGMIREMQNLDPNRFPGNPALVEQLHNQVLASVDKLELQLRRQAEDQQGGQVRSGDSSRVPSGYNDAWAEYTRRLSKEK
jgi:hypothetical protein